MKNIYGMEVPKGNFEYSEKSWFCFYESYKKEFFLIHFKATAKDYIDYLKKQFEELRKNSDGSTSAINQLNALKKYIELNK